MEAQAIANELLSSWLLSSNEELVQLRGAIAGRPGWEWRLSGRDESRLQPFGLHVGRLEVVRPAKPAEQATGVSMIPLVTVEFLSSSTITAQAAARGGS